MAETSNDSLNEGLFQLLFEKSPGSILIRADAPRFTVAAASDSYLQITSVKREDVLGKGFFEVFPDTGDDPDDDNTARKVFTKVIETGQKVDVPVYRYDVKDAGTKKMSEHYWSCSNIPIPCAEGKVAYILNTVVDITGEVKAKKAAIESENRLLMAADATGLAFWVLDIKTADFSFSPQMGAIFGHPHNTEISLSFIRNQVHPDDMQNIVLTAYNRALVTGHYEYEVRIFWPDESIHWIRTKGMVLFNNKNQPERMLGTIVDVTESRRDEERKNDFIAMASHELKTPLTSLKAYIQLLEVKLSASSDPFVASSLTKALNQVNKMTALIHGFLDLSKIEPGKLQLKKNVFDINKLVQDVIAESRVIAGTHSLKFASAGVIKVNADREKIGQVISNFISNAIKYSPKGSTVTLATEITENQVRVSVADEGVGIKPKDQEKIFQRFYRVEDDDMKHVAGFGIGLYLSSEIVHRHKGSISLLSEEGKGSVFSFTLPLPE